MTKEARVGVSYQLPVSKKREESADSCRLVGTSTWVKTHIVGTSFED